MSSLQITQHGMVSTLTINRPEKHNSLSPTDIEQMMSLLDSLDQDPNVRALVITGSGDTTFCAGASFDNVKDGSLRGDAFSPLARTIQSLSIPSVCLLNGNVYGGGVELALACDFRCGIEGAQLRVPIAKLGLSYSEYGLKLYHAKLGLAASKRILLGADTVDFDALQSMSFFDTVSADLTSARAQCAQLSEQLSQRSPLALNTMRKALDGLSMQSFDATEFDGNEQACFDSEDKQEGFEALLARRDPEFNGC
ncbi:MAG: enoyl-CoA hydratase/isomerase family protein [Pseudomonadota bacterium]